MMESEFTPQLFAGKHLGARACAEGEAPATVGPGVDTAAARPGRLMAGRGARRSEVPDRGAFAKLLS